MLFPVLLILLCCVLVMLVVMTYKMHAVIKSLPPDDEQERAGLIQGWIYAAIIGIILAILVCIYSLVKGTPLEGHLMEWLNIVVRVMHFTFGIAWIGASFYFVFLENALNRTDNVREELAGNLWAVHGGGFYYLEKYKVAPKNMPQNLRWFKYEAYFTWISGFVLLFIVYYFNASSLLVDPNVFKMGAGAALGIGIGSFIVAWLIYDLMCKSKLVEKPVLFAFIGILILTGFAYFYSHIYSGRGAFIHFGAMIGSIMVANVFFVIIPAQKAMVKAAKGGIPPDVSRGKIALFRSINNNYFTLPVLFVMVSNHFPSTFGNANQWAVLAAISIGSAGVRHWLNLREQGKISVWILPASIIVLLAVAYVTAPQRATSVCKEVVFPEINAIIQKRCVQCHSSRPTDNVYTAAPNGVKYDTPQEVLAKKDLIMQRVVITKTMPQNNKTNMTLEERDAIRCWIEQGARLK